MYDGITDLQGGGVLSKSDLVKWLFWESSNDGPWISTTGKGNNSWGGYGWVKHLAGELYVRVYRQVTTGYTAARIYDCTDPENIIEGAEVVLNSVDASIYGIRITSTGFIAFFDQTKMCACTYSGTTITVGSVTTISSGTSISNGCILQSPTNADVMMIFTRKNQSTLECQYHVVSGTSIAQGSLDEFDTSLASGGGYHLKGSVVASNRVMLFFQYDDSTSPYQKVYCKIYEFDPDGSVAVTTVTGANTLRAAAGTQNGTTQSALNNLNNLHCGEFPVHIGDDYSTVFIMTHVYYEAGIIREVKISPNIYDHTLDQIDQGQNDPSYHKYQVLVGGDSSPIMQQINNNLIALTMKEKKTSQVNLQFFYMDSKTGRKQAVILRDACGVVQDHPGDSFGLSISFDLNADATAGFMAGNFYNNKAFYKAIAPSIE